MTKTNLGQGHGGMFVKGATFLQLGHQDAFVVIGCDFTEESQLEGVAALVVAEAKDKPMHGTRARLTRLARRLVNRTTQHNDVVGACAGFVTTGHAKRQTHGRGTEATLLVVTNLNNQVKRNPDEKQRRSIERQVGDHGKTFQRKTFQRKTFQRKTFQAKTFQAKPSESSKQGLTSKASLGSPFALTRTDFASPCTIFPSSSQTTRPRESKLKRTVDVCLNNDDSNQIEAPKKKIERQVENQQLKPRLKIIH